MQNRFFVFPGIFLLIILLNSVYASEDIIKLGKTAEIKDNNTETEQEQVIKLESNLEKDSPEYSIIYKSKKEYIRVYAAYGFAIFCIFLIVLFLIERKRLEIKEE